jgi:hypothetical protein
LEKDENFEYTITWMKLKIPDIGKIKGQDEGGEKSTGPEEMIFEKIKTNLEAMIYQVEVKVKNKDSGFFYSLSTWIHNDQAKVNLAL